MMTSGLGRGLQIGHGSSSLLKSSETSGKRLKSCRCVMGSRTLGMIPCHDPCVGVVFPGFFQAIVRGRRARRHAAAIREANLRSWVATRLQSRYRARQQRRAYILQMMQRRTEHAIVTKIQTRFRMRRAREEMERRKHAAWVKRCNAAATKMQKIFRGKQARDLMRMARNARLQYFNKCMEAASNVQRIWRGRQGRKAFKLALAARSALAKAKDQAAMLLGVRQLLPVRPFCLWSGTLSVVLSSSVLSEANLGAYKLGSNGIGGKRSGKRRNGRPCTSKGTSGR